ncbi:MAG: zinc ribbon domain regulatory protein CdsZ [Chlamydiales bacterium]
MLEVLKPILEIQELDIQMIRLMRLKKQRNLELQQILSLRNDLDEQYREKEAEIASLNEQIAFFEQKIEDFIAKIKKLEQHQATVKKVDEFNTLTQEMTSVEREKISLEQNVSNLVDKRVSEEEILEKIKESLESSEANSLKLEEEIQASLHAINKEGRSLQEKREHLTGQADENILKIYEKLLYNKKDRVIVPLENRVCSGCHISLTPQHENLVRKGENLTFCEHCSRIHYWQESAALESGGSSSRKRRRKALTT